MTTPDVHRQRENDTSVMELPRIEKSATVQVGAEEVTEPSRETPPPKRGCQWLWLQRMKDRGQQGRARDGEEREGRSALYVIVPLAAVLFIVQFGYVLCDVPTTRLMEDIICREFYGNYSTATSVMTYTMLNETSCAATPVQAELNFVATGMAIAIYVPGLLVALFFGMLSDTWGRRPVFWLCVSGMILSNVLILVICWTWQHGSIRRVWASSLALFIGGGGSVAEGVVFAMLSDLSTDSNRATHFQVAISAVLLSETLAPIAANSLMEVSVWLPLILGPSISTFGSLLMIFFPETAASRVPRGRGWCPDTILSLRAPYTGLKETCKLFARHRAITLLVPAAALTIPVSSVAMGISLRYIALRFHIALGHTGVLLGVRTGLCVVILVVLVPLVSYAMRRWWRPGSHLVGDVDIGDVMKNDLSLAQIGCAAHIVGLVIFAAAPKLGVAILGLMFSTLGAAVPSLCRALVADLTEGSHAGRLFAGLAIIEMIGYLAVGVGLGALFQTGILKYAVFMVDFPSRANAYLALPFYVCALLVLAVSLPLWIARLPAVASSLPSPGRAHSLRGKDGENTPLGWNTPEGHPASRQPESECV